MIACQRNSCAQSYLPRIDEYTERLYRKYVYKRYMSSEAPGNRACGTTKNAISLDEKFDISRLLRENLELRQRNDELWKIIDRLRARLHRHKHRGTGEADTLPRPHSRVLHVKKDSQNTLFHFDRYDSEVTDSAGEMTTDNADERTSTLRKSAGLTGDVLLSLINDSSTVSDETSRKKRISTRRSNANFRKSPTQSVKTFILHEDERSRYSVLSMPPEADSAKVSPRVTSLTEKSSEKTAQNPLDINTNLVETKTTGAGIPPPPAPNTVATSTESSILGNIFTARTLPSVAFESSQVESAKDPKAIYVITLLEARQTAQNEKSHRNSQALNLTRLWTVKKSLQSFYDLGVAVNEIYQSKDIPRVKFPTLYPASIDAAVSKPERITSDICMQLELFLLELMVTVCGTVHSTLKPIMTSTICSFLLQNDTYVPKMMMVAAPLPQPLRAQSIARPRRGPSEADNASTLPPPLQEPAIGEQIAPNTMVSDEKTKSHPPTSKKRILVSSTRFRNGKLSLGGSILSTKQEYDVFHTDRKSGTIWQKNLPSLPISNTGATDSITSTQPSKTLKFWGKFFSTGNGGDKSGDGKSAQKPRSRLSGQYLTYGTVAEPIDMLKVTGQDASNIRIPMLVYRCIEYLEAYRAGDEVGIYRLSGSTSSIRELTSMFDNNVDFDIIHSVKPFDVHTVAGVLKQYLRSMPEPILTTQFFNSFNELKGRDMPEIDFYRQLHDRLLELPADRYALIRAMTGHLHRILEKAEINKMSLQNLCIIFSPTLRIPAGILIVFLREFTRIFCNQDGDENENTQHSGENGNDAAVLGDGMGAETEGTGDVYPDTIDEALAGLAPHDGLDTSNPLLDVDADNNDASNVPTPCKYIKEIVSTVAASQLPTFAP